MFKMACIFFAAVIIFCTGCYEDSFGVSIKSASVTEGNSGSTDLKIKVKLNMLSTVDTVIQYTIIEETATIADGDFYGTSGVLTIPANVMEGYIDVVIYGDTYDEGNETFRIVINSISYGTIYNGTARITILDDDIPPVVSISDESATEGDSGTSVINFTVSLSHAYHSDVQVTCDTSDGSAEDETGDCDYQSLSSYVLTIPSGTLEADLPVTIYGDTVDEGDQTFSLTLSSPVNCELGTAVGTGTILCDDSPPLISIYDNSIIEPDSGAAAFYFTVELSFASSSDVSVDYSPSHQTATSPDDYSSVGGTLTIPAGNLTGQVMIPVYGDTRYEYEEFFYVFLTNPVNGVLLDDKAVGTIIDNDSKPSLSVNDVTHSEGDSGQTDFIFTVSVSEPAGVHIEFDFTINDGTAHHSDNDYIYISGYTMSMNYDDVETTITVSVRGDTIAEADETFFLVLSNPKGAVISDGTGQGTILNDD